MSKTNAVIGFIFGLGLGFFLWGREQPKIVLMPPEQAQTPSGVVKASQAVDVILDKKQASEIAGTIKDLEKESEEARKKAQADLAIITNPYDLSKYDGKPLELNQYNIRAYKQRLCGITYYPKNVINFEPAMLAADYSIRISKSGKYLGVAVAYNLDNDRAYLGLRYEF